MGYELTHKNKQIGSSVRPREVATHGSIGRRFEIYDLYKGRTGEEGMPAMWAK